MNGFLVEVKVDVLVQRGCVKMWMRMGDVMQKYVFAVKEFQVWVVSGFQLLSKFWDMRPSGGL